MLLIAATYGMARFGVGLFAPLLAAQRPELTEVLGWAAAAQFTSYSIAAVAAARFVDRAPRAGLLLAGGTAAVGCLGVAVASAPDMFVAAVFVGGMGGGFASPALVPVIDALVPRRTSATAQSLVNSGTAVGVVGAGMVASMAASIAGAWVLMALVCAAAAVAAWYPVRARADPGTSSLPATAAASSPERRHGPGHLLLVPAGAAVIAGAGSALVWTFGPLLVTEAGSVAAAQAGWLWIALGLGGVLGVLTGAMARRMGMRAAWCFSASVLAVASLAVSISAASGSTWVAYAGMAVFGAGYMSLSGVLILWARSVWPQSAGAGTSWLFIALAIGQVLGSAGFGVAYGALPPVVLAALAAGLLVLGGITGLVRMRQPQVL
jgi:predicted MFS family arabinose efflux permease